MARMMGAQPSEGFRYLPEFLSSGDEGQMLEHLEQLSFESVHMQGVVARRRGAALRVAVRV